LKNCVSGCGPNGRLPAADVMVLEQDPRAHCGDCRVIRIALTAEYLLECFDDVADRKMPVNGVTSCLW
jgi:hypothetical protein